MGKDSGMDRSLPLHVTNRVLLLSTIMLCLFVRSCAGEQKGRFVDPGKPQLRWYVRSSGFDALG
jgi:hypothetical protein